MNVSLKLISSLFQTGLELETMFWRIDLLNMLRVYLLPLILLPLVSMASHLLQKLCFKGWFHHLTYSCLIPDDEAKSKRILSSNGYHKFLWRINNSQSSESNCSWGLMAEEEIARSLRQQVASKLVSKLLHMTKSRQYIGRIDMKNIYIAHVGEIGSAPFHYCKHRFV